MPISPSSLRYYLSGGSGNTDPNAALGGARSTTTIVPVNLFDPVTGDQSAVGNIEYRCVYFRQEDADVNGLIDPVLWVRVNTPSDDSSMAIGIDPAGKNGTAAIIIDDSAAPVGVSFSSPSTKLSGLFLPDAPYLENDYVAFWVRRTIRAGASSASTDPAIFRIQGDQL